MNRTIRFRWGVLLVLGGLLLACALPQLSPATQNSAPDLTFTQTAVALQQTQVALQLTLQAPSSAPASPAVPATATAGSTAPTATWSPTATQPPTATLAASPTAAAGQGLAGHAIGNLYCRTGPAPYYPAVDTMHAGDQVAVMARASQGDNYWLVRTPHGEICWVWGRWLNIAGDPQTLPEATPPPAPPAAVSVTLLRQDACWGNTLVFSIVNRGPKPIESIWIHIKDLSTGNTFEIPPANRDVFYYCSGQLDTLDPSQDVEVWVDVGAVDLSGHTVQVTVKTCTEEGLQGQCIQRTPFNVNVP